MLLLLVGLPLTGSDIGLGFVSPIRLLFLVDGERCLFVSNNWSVLLVQTLSQFRLDSLSRQLSLETCWEIFSAAGLEGFSGFSGFASCKA